jgi:ribosome biogenesis GTPase
VDLLDRAPLERFRATLARYEAIGYPCAWTSLQTGQGLSCLSPLLRGETSILVGQSGVGKSSLTKALLADQRIQIGCLSKATGLGRHTTSAATCYRLPEGGRLIDSPGVRSFRLGPIGRQALQSGFRDLAPFAGRCRFGDCHHDREPGCAVAQAVLDGRIHPQRLASFRALAAQQKP